MSGQVPPSACLPGERKLLREGQAEEAAQGGDRGSPVRTPTGRKARVPAGWDTEAPLQVTLLHARQVCPGPQGGEAQEICTLAQGLVKETGTGAVGVAEGIEAWAAWKAPFSEGVRAFGGSWAPLIPMCSDSPGKECTATSRCSLGGPGKLVLDKDAWALASTLSSSVQGPHQNHSLQAQPPRRPALSQGPTSCRLWLLSSLLSFCSCSVCSLSCWL